MKIRDATAGDVDEILAFFARARTEPTGVGDDPESLRRVIDSDHAWLLVADDGGIVGTVLAGWDGWRASIYRLAVDPGRRREGIARALVEAAEDRLVGAGARKILAIVIREHDHAFGFWQGIGYEQDPRLARFAKTVR